ncbi:MAG: RNA methyltransferase [Gemmataceae bacterium]
MRACRVVLVRPQNAGNIGSAARAMRNMGATDLVLVAPVPAPLDDLAVAMATRHASGILESARVVATLDEAVADCVLTAGTSARVGGLYRRQTVLPVTEMAPRLVAAMPAGPVALVFGPERTGLENDEVTHLHWQVTIPADDEYPVMNLAQAVTVCLWEVRRAWLGEPGASAPGGLLPPDIAPFADQERMFRRLRQALARVQFLRGGRANALFHAVRHLIGRAQPSAMEVKVLLGLAQQLNYVADRGTLDDDVPYKDSEPPAPGERRDERRGPDPVADAEEIDPREGPRRP